MQFGSLDVDDVCLPHDFVCPPFRMGLKNKIGENKDTGNAITFNFAFFRIYCQIRLVLPYRFKVIACILSNNFEHNSSRHFI